MKDAEIPVLETSIKINDFHMAEKGEQSYSAFVILITMLVFITTIIIQQRSMLPQWFHMNIKMCNGLFERAFKV